MYQNDRHNLYFRNICLGFPWGMEFRTLWADVGDRSNLGFPTPHIGLSWGPKFVHTRVHTYVHL